MGRLPGNFARRVGLSSNSQLYGKAALGQPGTARKHPQPFWAEGTKAAGGWPGGQSTFV